MKEKVNMHAERLKTIEVQLATLVSSLKAKDSSARKEEFFSHGDVETSPVGSMNPTRMGV